jgi:hypothetical protein
MRNNRIAAVALGAALAWLVIPGCGGGDDGGESGTPEQAAQAFTDAFGAGDADTACAMLTEEGGESFEEYAGGSCEENIEGASEEELAAIGDGTVRLLQESDEEATVEVAIPEDEPTTLGLVKEDEEWKIESVTGP